MLLEFVTLAMQCSASIRMTCLTAMMLPMLRLLDHEKLVGDRIWQCSRSLSIHICLQSCTLVLPESGSSASSDVHVGGHHA